MIKVVQVIECGGPGGTGEQVAAICNGLDPRRFSVSLIYAVRSGAPADFRKKCRGAATAVHLPEMVREISPANDGAAFLKLRRLFQDIRPDVVHAHSSKAGVLARLAGAAANVPVTYYSPHGYGFLMQDRAPSSRTLFRIIERTMMRFGETIAVSPSEAEFARALSRHHRVHTVCDAYLGDFREPLAHQELRIGSSGRMTYARNPEAWVRLTGRIIAGKKDVDCVWIGGGEDEPRAQAELTRLGLRKRVTVTGWVTAEEARERLRGLDVFVHFSRWDAMPNAVLEAMAAGLPVVASDVPGNRDAVVDGVTGFLVRSELELMERCEQLLKDEELRSRLGRAGRERVRAEFSLSRMLDELSRLYSRRPEKGELL